MVLCTMGRKRERDWVTFISGKKGGHAVEILDRERKRGADVLNFTFPGKRGKGGLKRLYDYKKKAPLIRNRGGGADHYYQFRRGKGKKKNIKFLGRGEESNSLITLERRRGKGGGEGQFLS